MRDEICSKTHKALNWHCGLQLLSVKGRGLMDKASGYGPEDCGFKSHRLCFFIKPPQINLLPNATEKLKIKKVEAEFWGWGFVDWGGG